MGLCPFFCIIDITKLFVIYIIMAVLSDFLAAVNQIAAERGINPDEVLEAVQAAIRTGYKKNYDTGESLIIDIDKKLGTVKVYADKKVVDKVSDPATQIALEDARMIEPKLKIGDHLEVDVTPEGDFGRIAVQAAKQVILQKIRESEKEAVMKEFKDKIGTIENGIIQRMDGDNVIVEIHKAIAIMPAEDRLPKEFYRSGMRLKFLLKKIQRTVSGKQLIVSRNDPKFLVELFGIEVPEIRSESIEIIVIAREAGSRSKVAVVSNQEGIDPIGACVGQKGIRIDNITDELKGEKIDIILWDQNIDTFIMNSLSPAQVSKIKLNKKEKSAKVIVPDDQLSLAIGKEGQNVRLAAKLTGWKIDIEGESETKEAKSKVKKSKALKKIKDKEKGKKNKIKVKDKVIKEEKIKTKEKKGTALKDPKKLTKKKKSKKETKEKTNKSENKEDNLNRKKAEKEVTLKKTKEITKDNNREKKELYEKNENEPLKSGKEKE
jgi:N utilization substance protein A